MAPLNPFLPVGVYIYKLSFISPSTVLVELVEAYLKVKSTPRAS